MVQRKVANKLGIQAERVKSEKLLVSLKPSSSSYHLDVKNNKGADLKKKMKRSGSLKRPEFDRPRSPNFRNQVQQPGKPPPVVSTTAAAAVTAAATPKKQSPMTSVIDNTNTPNYMKSTTSSDARKERAQVSTHSPQTFPDRRRSSRRSLLNEKNNSDPGNKPARTLTKTSSLKLVRTLTKTPSFKLSRASAKKHSQVIFCENLNVQKATCSSTMKGHKFPGYLTLNPGATEVEGTSVMKVCPYTYCSLNGHHHEPLPPLKCFLSARRRMLKGQRNLKLGCLSPRRAKPVRDIMKEFEAVEVNVEAKPLVDESWNSPTSSPVIQEESEGFFIEVYSKEREDTFGNNQDSTDSSVTDAKPNIGGVDETKTENDGVKSADECAHLRKDDNFEEMDLDEYKTGEEVYTSFSPQGKTKQDFLNLVYESDAEYTPSIQSEADLETSDMDWEAGPYSASYPHDEAANPIRFNLVIDLEKANSALDSELLNEVTSKSHEFTGENCEENLPDEIAQELIDDETESEGWFGETVKETSLVSEFEEGSTPEDVTRNMATEVGNEIDSNIGTQYEVVATTGMWDPEYEGHVDMEIQKFENPNDMSPNMNANLKNSIGTQTDRESDDCCDMSSNLNEASKRSIGIQTDDIDEDQSDDLIEMFYFSNKVLDGSTIANENKESDGENTSTADSDESQLGGIFNEGEPNLHDALQDQVHDYSSSFLFPSITSSNVLDSSENKLNEPTEVAESIIFGDQSQSQMTGPSPGNADQNIHKSQVDPIIESGTRNKGEPVSSNSNEELTCSIIKGKNRSILENKEPKEFNPRAPNFLPSKPDPEAEKVDLRHLMLDENKNAEGWMLDHALQQAVTKLAPARKRKVALLVEAFETVLPIPKYESHLRLNSRAFSNVRQIQACN